MNNMNVTRIQIIAVISSLLAFFYIAWDPNSPDGFQFYMFLPFSFAVASVLGGKLYRMFRSNLGVTFIILLEFFRLVVLPVITVLGNYQTKFFFLTGEQIRIATALLIFELFTVFFIMTLTINKKRSQKIIKNNAYYSSQRMNWIIIILSVLVAFTFVLEPACFKLYRTIFGIMDPNFTGLETSTMINMYGTTTVTKFAMVMNNYSMKILRFLLPLHIIYLIHRRSAIDKSPRNYFLCIIVISTQFLIVDGTIARSFFYATILLLVTVSLYNKERHILKYIILSSVGIFIYFILRYITNYDNNSMFEFFSRTFNAYFSGITNVAGSMNMNCSMGEVIKYILYDFLKAIPFGNTIFGLDETSFQIAFNVSNYVTGQIPTLLERAIPILVPCLHRFTLCYLQCWL
jgi:hypothetical protein